MESIDLLNGIGQDDPLSMILYVIYDADLLEIGNKKNKDSLGYVDDVTFITIGKDLEESTRQLEHMMIKEDGTLQWGKGHNSKFEVTKSVVLHATRRTQLDLRKGRGRIPINKPPLQIEGQQIQAVNSFKYLGVKINTQLRWKEQAQRAAANTTKWILQFQRLTKPCTGVGSKLMRQLYLAAAIPKITYGIDTWYIPPHKSVGATKNSGLVGTLRSLQKLQQMATLAIMDVLHMSPTDLLDMHTSILLIELALLKAYHRTLVRMLALHATHPLSQVITNAKCTPPKNHPGPIDLLLLNFKLSGTKMKRTVLAVKDPNQCQRFRVEIPDTRDLSIEKEDLNQANYKVFVDGSGHKRGIGVAVVIFKKESRQPLEHLKAYLSPPTTHNTYEAEAVGGILAIWLIQSTAGTDFKNVSLYIDKQALITTLVSPKPTSGQYLIHAFSQVANNTKTKLRICWISSHSEVKGNELADSLAKEAAAGKASCCADLLPLLRKLLPASASATKQEHFAHLNRKWKSAWLSKRTVPQGD